MVDEIRAILKSDCFDFYDDDVNDVLFDNLTGYKIESIAFLKFSKCGHTFSSDGTQPFRPPETKYGENPTKCPICKVNDGCWVLSSTSYGKRKFFNNTCLKCPLWNVNNFGMCRLHMNREMYEKKMTEILSEFIEIDDIIQHVLIPYLQLYLPDGECHEPTFIKQKLNCKFL